MEKQTTDLVTGKKSITGATETVVERLREQTLDTSSLLYPFIDKLKNTSGRTLFPFVDTIDSTASRFTIGSIELVKSDDFTIAEVSDETIEDSNLEVGVDLAVQNILDIQMVKKIEKRLTQALMSDTSIHYTMSPNWEGIKSGILALGTGTSNIVGDIYVAVSLTNYLVIIEQDEFENTMRLLGNKIRFVVMEEFSDTQILVMHEHGVSGGLKVKELELSRRPMYDRVDYIAPYNYSFGWDSKYVKFGGVIPPFMGRYFRRNEGTTDRALFSEVNLTDDFEINTLFSTIGSSSHVLFGDDNSSSNLLAFIGSGTIRLVVGGDSVFEVDNQNLNDGVLHYAVIKRVGNLITLYVGGVLIGSGNSTNTFTLSSLYAHNDGSAAFLGILADFKIYDDGVLIRDYPLDDNSDILVNKATVLGFEKVLNPNFNTNSDWTLNANHVITGGQLVINGAGAFSHSKQIVDVSAGKTQKLSVNYDNTQTNVKINIFDGQTTGESRIIGKALDTAGGTYDFYFTPSTDKVLIYIETVNVYHYVAFNYVSIKEADGYGTVINGTEDQWYPFTEQPITIEDRYYRYNEGTTDYATIPVITMSSDVVIEFNVNAPPQGDNNVVSFRNTNSFNTFGLASGRVVNGSTAKLRIFSNAIPVVDAATSMDVFDNTEHTVRFEYTASTNSCRVLVDGVVGITPRTLGYNFAQSDLLTLWRDVTSGDEMAGVISDLKIYDGGVLVRNYPIDDNSDTLTDTVSGADGTVINGTSDQWYLDGKVGGDWLGEELITQDVWENPENPSSQWTFADNRWYLDGDGENSALSLLQQSDQPYRMILTGNVLDITGQVTVGATLAPTLEGVGIYSFDLIRDDITLQQFKRKVGVATVTLEKPSLKEVLKV
jgi:hypothetical protein